MAEEITYKINLDADQMENSLKNINTEITTLNQSTKDLEATQTQLKNSGKENSEAFNKNAAIIKDNEKQVGKLNKEYKSTDKTLQSTTKSTDKMSKSAAGATKTTGKMGTTMGKSAGMFGKFGGIIGSLPKMLQGAMGAVRAFGVVVAANPIGLIVTAIVLLMGLMVAALSKFKPITEWISDKIAGLMAMVDTFVNSMEQVGKIIKAVFQGDFAEAAKMAGELTDKMNEARIAQEEYNKVLRETAVERALNDATTARAMTQMKEWDAIIKDTTKSEEDRLKASKDLGDAREEQANDDLKATKTLVDAQIKLLRSKHAAEIETWEAANGRTLSTMEDIAELSKKDAQFREDGITMLKSMQQVKEEEAKVSEVISNTEKEQNKIRLKGLADTLKALKSQAKLNAAKSKSVLEGEAQLTQDLLDEEEKRLKNNGKILLLIAKQEYDARLVAAGSNTALITEAENLYAITKINIRKETNKKILDNDQKLMKQQLTELETQTKIFLLENKGALKDNIAVAQKEVDEKIKILDQLKEKNIENINERARIENWSASKLKLKLLEIENKYVDDVNKLQDVITKQKDAQTKILLDIEKNYLNSITLSAEEIRQNKLAVLEQEEIDLIASLDEKILSEKAYNTAVEQIEATTAAKKKAIDDEEKAKRTQDTQEALGTAMDLSNTLMDFNDMQRDAELTKISNQYNEEDRLADEKLEKEKARLKKQFDDGLITEKSYNTKIDKLEEDFDKAKGIRDGNRLKEEDKAKKEAFDKNKKFQIANIIMDTASAIIGTLAGYAKLGPVGAVLALIQTGIITATGLAQSAQVASTEFSAAGGGILEGPLHAAGGINMGDVEAEGGEYIINRASTQRYTPLLNSINSAGNTNGDATNTSDIIDYERLANVLQSKKVYVVSHDISDQQTEDIDIKTSVEF